MSRKLTRRDLVWMIPAAGLVGFSGWFLWRLWYIRLRGKPTASAVVQWKEGSAVQVAELASLPEVWNKAYFDYPFATGQLPAVLVRIPQPVEGGVSYQDAHFVALSRICTHQGCKTNYVPDSEAGAIAYNFRSETPFMGCPCHFGAFDPAQAGRSVYGPPVHPLGRLRLEVRDQALWVTAYETPMRPLET